MAEEREASVHLLKTLAPLDGLKRENLAALAKKVAVRTLSAGRPLFKEGDTDKRTVWVVDGMVEVLHALKAPLMIPMHYFSAYTLDRFLQRVRQDWEVEMAQVPSLVVSKTSLPAKPKVIVLPGH